MKYPSPRRSGLFVVAIVLAATLGCSANRPWFADKQSDATTKPSSSSDFPKSQTSNLFPESASSQKPTVRAQNDGSNNYAPASAPSYSPADVENGYPPNYGYRPTNNGYAPGNGRGSANGYGTSAPNGNPANGGSGNSYQPPARTNQPYTSYQPPNGNSPGGGQVLPPPRNGQPLQLTPFNPVPGGPGDFIPGDNNSLLGMPNNFADIDAIVEEARTGRLMFGVGVNSDAGVTGQIVVDERNFDISKPPTSWDDIASGRAWRGAGQGFRVEAAPGTQVSRYLVSFTEPYLFDTPISLSLSGFYYDRGFFDWEEQRLGGRAALGYRLTHDLSVSLGMRAERVKLFNPRVRGVPELEAALGDNSLYIPQLTIAHDTRDIPFFPTEGHLIELTFQQGLGDFDYSKADIDLRRYFLLRQRPDGSGRHTLALGLQAGFSGEDTPIFENYFAGGFSTLRGFDFRGASPVDKGVIVGGRFQFIGAVEYFFPITADDMLKGVVFCDFGTVERDIEIQSENFRVAPGFGLRVNIPALGPAPLAFDFAFPVSEAATDQKQVFSFFLGIGR